MIDSFRLSQAMIVKNEEDTILFYGRGAGDYILNVYTVRTAQWVIK